MGQSSSSESPSIEGFRGGTSERTTLDRSASFNFVSGRYPASHSGSSQRFARRPLQARRGDHPPPPSYPDALTNGDIRIHNVAAWPGADSRFHADARDVKLMFDFCPDRTKGTWSQTWAARLYVKCDNVPLIRNGLHIDSTNLIPGANFFDKCPDDAENPPRWFGTRHFFAADNSRMEHWTATLLVHGEQNTTLFPFDLGQITLQNLSKTTMVASNGQQTCVFCYQCGVYASTIYDGMGGLWPSRSMLTEPQSAKDATCSCRAEI